MISLSFCTPVAAAPSSEGFSVLLSAAFSPLGSPSGDDSPSFVVGLEGISADAADAAGLSTAAGAAGKTAAGAAGKIAAGAAGKTAACLLTVTGASFFLLGRGFGVVSASPSSSSASSSFKLEQNLLI